MSGAAKKTAASPAPVDEKDVEQEQKAAQARVNEPQNGPTDTSGPGTGTPAPPESSYRTPSTIVEDPDGAPLEPPTDTKTQVEPAQGYNESSTDHVMAAAGRITYAGEDYKAIVGDDGKKVTPGNLFDDSDGSKTFVTAKQRVYEEFYYPNTTEVCQRLLFPAGARVPRAQAESIKQAIKDAPKPLAEQG